jgi:hypothetical protein
MPRTPEKAFDTDDKEEARKDAEGKTKQGRPEHW